MVSRRKVLLGAAATVGVAALGTGTAAATTRPGASSLAGALPPGAVFGMPLPGGAVCPVAYMSRSAWGADESLRFSGGVEVWPAEYYPVQALTVHHTGVANPNPDDPAAFVRSIYVSQAVNQPEPWGDIGYHLLIDEAGTVYEGRWSGTDANPIFAPNSRTLMNTGGHAFTYNTGNIGICLLGHFGGALPTTAARGALVTVLASLAYLTGINPLGAVNYANPVNGQTKTVLGVTGHRDWNATECPGDAFYPILAEIRTAVAAAIPPPPMPSPAPSQEPPPVVNPDDVPIRDGQPEPTGGSIPVPRRT